MENNDNKLISKKVVRSWLEGYTELYRAWGPVDAEMPKCNSGKKPEDGITDKVLNRAMLSAALRSMWHEAGILFYCCNARWVRPQPLGKTLRSAGISKDKYYYRCDRAVDYIYYHVNHMDKERLRMLAKLKRRRIIK